MITRRTVLVLGAGSNRCFGFPLGSDLYRTVCGLLDSPPLLPGYVDTHKRRALQRKLCQSGVCSVDEFLEFNPDLIPVGKAEIARALLPSERIDLLRVQYASHWYQYLWSRLRGEARSLDGNLLSIITFNYDRSLEHYLLTVLRNLWSLSEMRASQELRKIPIVHVHGQLGYLPWQTWLPGFEEDLVVPYGGILGIADELAAEPVSRAAQCVRIICEKDVEQDTSLGEARKLLDSAEVVLFLGFGYHPTNLRRLGFGGGRPGGQEVYGTCVGLEAPEMNRIHNGFGINLGSQLHLDLNPGRLEILDFLRKTAYLQSG